MPVKHDVKKGKQETDKAGETRQILLVDDHPVLREGFARLINFEADLNVCGQVGSAEECLSVIQEEQPDLVIVDISLGGTSGLELTKQIRALYPEMPVLILSMHEESLYAERAVRAGARGYVVKKAATTVIIDAIRQVLQGEMYLSEKMRTEVINQYLRRGTGGRRSSMEQLTDRELEVFQLIGNGLGSRQIASQLNLSIKTVETHRAHIKEKLGLQSNTELVRHAVFWGQEQT